jgi:hypothetical protein
MGMMVVCAPAERLNLKTGMEGVGAHKNGGEAVAGFCGGG